ncbi:MAG: hypothetical protein OEW75_00395 [Cyclobacteriaceae bacterium]|nr:hypothetical protein [Cyclobacteriaceae bacterium]
MMKTKFLLLVFISVFTSEIHAQFDCLQFERHFKKNRQLKNDSYYHDSFLDIIPEERIDVIDYDFQTEGFYSIAKYTYEKNYYFIIGAIDGSGEGGILFYLIYALHGCSEIKVAELSYIGYEENVKYTFKDNILKWNTLDMKDVVIDEIKLKLD